MKGALIFTAGATVGIVVGAVGAVCTTSSLSSLLYGLLDKAVSKFETEEQAFERLRAEADANRVAYIRR